MQHIEEQIAFLTRTVDELNEIVTEQQAAVERLRKQVDVLMAREADREAAGGAVVFGDERPPHY